LNSFAAVTIAVESVVRLSVRGALTTSTRGMTATGLKKWNPLRGAPDAQPGTDLLNRKRRGAGREHGGLRDRSTSANTKSCLTPSALSNTASITQSQAAKSALSVPVTRP
jgi:hypothetical protein